MIIWICSYPRSGNTLSRIILKRCFGAQSYTVYDPNKAGRIADITGTAQFDGTVEELLAAARTAASPMFVKTHECAIPNDEKAIYIVRDGRASLSSFRKYQAVYNGEKFALEEMVLGMPPAPSWAAHASWGAARPAETTLVLRYEDLCQPSPKTLARIGRFVELRLRGSLDVSFDQLCGLLPEFFQTGSNTPGIEEIESTCPALFWLVNGDAMRLHGYVEDARQLSPELCAEAAEEMKRFAIRQRAKINKNTPANAKMRPADRVNMRP